MKKRLLSLPILFLVSYYSFSQGVGIGTTTPDVSAGLDITATNKGLLIPRMSLTSINAIANPARGLLVYDSVSNRLMVNIGTPAAPNWQPVAGGSNGNAAWNLAGNTGIDPANQFVGTTDNQPLRFRINNIQVGELHPATGNISWGLRAGQSNTTGVSNIAIGTDALKLNTGSAKLVAIGDSALFNNTAEGNTAVGHQSLSNTTTGGNNSAVGFQSLFSNRQGNSNTAIGFESLFFNSIGSRNTATGFHALHANTVGANNTAAGFQSQGSNTSGSNNTSTGFQSLFANTFGNNNTAYGSGALFANATGDNNTAIGSRSLIAITTGVLNTAVGRNALSATTLSSNNTAVGSNAGSLFDLGLHNTLIGADADAGADGAINCVAIGQAARCTGNNQVRLGNTLTTSIGGVVGFSNLSDGRYKRNIQEEVKGIDFIMKLRPVTYQLDMPGLYTTLNAGSSRKKDEIATIAFTEKGKTIFSGFIAQEVEKAAKDAGYDFSGVEKPTTDNDLYGLRYAEFVVPLVKAVQEQQRMIEELIKQNAGLQKRILDLEKK